MRSRKRNRRERKSSVIDCAARVWLIPEIASFFVMGLFLLQFMYLALFAVFYLREGWHIVVAENNTKTNLHASPMLYEHDRNISITSTMKDDFNFQKLMKDSIRDA